MDAEREPAVVVEDGQREAPRPVAEDDVALVVHLPEVVGRLGLEADHRLDGDRLAEPPVTAENGCDGSGRRRGLNALVEEHPLDLAPAPARVLVADAEHGGFDLGRRAVRAAVRGPRLVGQGVNAALAVATEPLVGGLAADAEAACDLGDVGAGLVGEQDELSSEGHGGVGIPGHGDLQQVSLPEVLPMSPNTCHPCLLSKHRTGGAVEEPVRRGLGDRPLRGGVEPVDRCGPLERCLRLPDPLRSLNGDRGEGRNELVELGINDATEVWHGGVWGHARTRAAGRDRYATDLHGSKLPLCRPVRYGYAIRMSGEGSEGGAGLPLLVDRSTSQDERLRFGGAARSRAPAAWQLPRRTVWPERRLRDFQLLAHSIHLRLGAGQQHSRSARLRGC